MVRKIFKPVSWVLIILLAYMVYNSINKPIELQKEKKMRYEKAKLTLLKLRDIQLMYKELYGFYASNFEALFKMIEYDNYPIIQKRDTIVTYYDEIYLIDKTKTITLSDTLGIVKVKDTLFKKGITNYRDLQYVPYTNKKIVFSIKSDLLKKNKIKTPVFEIVASKKDLLNGLDLDFILQQEDALDIRGNTIRIGSLTDATINGNWWKVAIIQKYFTPCIFSENGNNLQLVISIDYNTLAFCIYQEIDKKILAMAEFEILPYNLESEISKIFNSEQLLEFDFEKISVSFFSEKFTFVPMSFFYHDMSSVYFKYNHYLSDVEKVNYDIMEMFQNEGEAERIVNIYSVNKKLYDYILQLYPNTIVLHFATTLIQAIYKNYDIDKENVWFINYKSSSFQIVQFKYKKLHFYNTFVYYNVEEYLYFLLSALNELNADLEKDIFYCIGLDISIDNNNKILQITSKYLKNIQTKVPFDVNKIDTALLPVLKNSVFFTLLNQHLCIKEF